MGGGTFSKSARPVLAGAYFDWDITAPPIIAPSIGRVVLVAFTHDWGPLGQATPLNSFAEFLDKFKGDPANPSSGYVAVYGAFKGEGSPDFGGAGQVLAYRMGGSSAAQATKTLQNTAGTPADALTISALYEGDRGNDLRVTTQDHAADPTQNELIVMDGATVVETYVFPDTNLADLANQINQTSSWISAHVVADGTALQTVTSQSLTGGDDGATLVATDYTAALANFELQKFGVLVFENLTDSVILSTIIPWTKAQNTAGRRFFTVFGGLLDENITAAIARSATMDSPDILNVGVGSVRDNDLKDANLQPVVLSSAQLASRIAGIVANRGERYSLTFSKLVGLDLLNGPSASDIVRAYDGGVIVLGRASDRQATVRIEKGLTTFIDKTNAAMPKVIFSVPRYVATMHGLQEDLVLWAEDNIVGKSTVDTETRQAVLAQINAFMRIREELGSIQPGWSAFVDPSPPPSDDDDFIAFVIAAKFGRSTEQVYFTGRLG
jgi:hypothetical protein